MFKNIQLYKLDSALDITPGQLDTLIRERPLVECAGITTQTRGFVPVNAAGELVVNVDRHYLIRFGVERRKVPAKVIRRLVDERAKAYEKEKNFKPGRKMLREMKEAALLELLPRAFADRAEHWMWIDLANSFIAVDTTSAGAAEDALTLLRDVLGTLGARPVTGAAHVGAILNSWLAGSMLPLRLCLCDTCELVGPDASKPTVKFSRHDLASAEVKVHLEEGKTATKVGLQWDGRVSFTVNSKMQIRGLKWEQSPESADAEQNADNAEDPLLANFAIAAGDCAGLLADVIGALGEKGEPAPSAGAAAPDGSRS